MPEDLLSTFRAGYEQSTVAFNGGDLDAALVALPEDLEWHAVSEDPERSILRGPEQIKRWFEEFRSVFDRWRVEPLDYEQLSESTILVHHVIRGTSRGAGVPIEVETYEIWEHDGNRPVRMRQFFSREEALAAAAGT